MRIGETPPDKGGVCLSKASLSVTPGAPGSPPLVTPTALACAACGAPIGGGRADARYCSGACRQRAYRRRARGLPDLARMGRYNTVVIDPPWSAKGYPTGYLDRARGPGRNGPPVHRDFDYPLMTVSEIAALPIPAVLERDSLVFLWTINRFIRAAFDVLDAWGLRFAFFMTWCKPHGPKPVGYPVYAAEYVLVAKRGKPAFLDTRDFSTVGRWEAPRNPAPAPGAWGRQIVACAKPEGFYDLLRRVTPAPRLDVFARRRIDGFIPWGNQAPLAP